MPVRRILIHSGKHPFEPFDYTADYSRAMATFGHNTGNLLFADAVFKYLYASPAHELRSDAYAFPTAAPDFAPEVINERHDCVVLPAANWLAGYYRDMLPRYAAKIRQLRTPCVVLGLGAQSGEQDDFGFLSRIANEAKDFLSAVSDRCHSISVRGEFTAECLRRLGFSNVNVTGCPSFYRNLQSFAVDPPHVGRTGFRLAVNGNKQHLARLAPALFERYPSVLFSQGDVLRVALQRWRAPARELKRACGDGFSLNLLARGRVRCFGDITPWIRELQQFHFSVGTRIHGNILALLSGVPALVVAHDSRTAEMAGFYRIPTVPFRSLASDADVYELYEAADYRPMHAAYAGRLANFARFFTANGLDHTLYSPDGDTYYDARIRELSFAPRGYEFGGPFFTLGRGVASTLSSAKRLKRMLSPSPRAVGEASSAPATP